LIIFVTDYFSSVKLKGILVAFVLKGKTPWQKV